MVGAGLKIVVLLGVGLAFLLPFAVWVERRHDPVLRARIGFSREGVDLEPSVWEFLRPLGNALRLLTATGRVVRGAHPILRELGPGLAIVAALVALAVLPFGAGPYRFDTGSGEILVSLVVADLDWGIYALFAALGMSQLADVLAGIARLGGRMESLRATVRMLALAVAMPLSTIGLCLCVGTTGLGEIVSLQDQSFRVFGLLETLGGREPLSPWLAWIRLPSWGVFLQPLGSVLFVACAWIAIERGRSFRSSVVQHNGTTERTSPGAFLTASFLERIVWASAITVLFLGGGAIPYLTGDAIIGFVARAYAEGFATGFAMLLHVGTFFTKVAGVLVGLAVLRARFAAPDHERAMTVICQYLLPAALANAIGTAGVLLWWERLTG